MNKELLKKLDKIYWDLIVMKSILQARQRKFQLQNL